MGMPLRKVTGYTDLNSSENLLKEEENLKTSCTGQRKSRTAFTRMKAQADSLLKAVGNLKTRSVFMDTGPAAIFGALTDPAAIQPSIVVNIGNGHTLGALVLENRITALFEHHSSLMNPEKLQDYIIRLADGKLGFDEVFADGGHGAYIKEAPGFEQIQIYNGYRPEERNA